MEEAKMKFNVDIEVLASNLKKRGYEVSCFKTSEEAREYLLDEIGDKSVGIGGSKTIESMGIFRSLEERGNTVWWHWKTPEKMNMNQVREKAATTDIYLTSVNAMSISGEMVNIDGFGNRLASSVYGHEKVYFITGLNKVEKSLEDAVMRARNIAAVKNSRRFNNNTPCVLGEEKCYDCSSPERICRGMMIHMAKMSSCEMEVILIEEELGY